ncbi:MAG: choice-of-anchor J domain-containing protein [Bacteroidia bacterium]|nr:choice-of-anchor J domain-containing protein [Bacteroidia bacterium]
MKILRLIIMLLGLMGLSRVSEAQISRSGHPAPAESRSQLRRFPCGGSVILNEDFNSEGLPGNWTLIDGDGLTPKTEIQFLTPNGGWQLIDDLKDPSNGNRSLASPAWYEGGSRSNDWLILPGPVTLPAQTCLSWYAYSQDEFYPEQYEVRISFTSPDTAAFLSQPAVQAISAEGTTFTYRTADLSAYAGQTVYLAFRHTSVDKFILVIDDIRLAEVRERDLAMFSLTDFTANAGNKVKFSGAVINRGLDTLRFDSAQMKISYRIDQGTIEQAEIRKKVTLLPNDTIRFSHDSTWIPFNDGVYNIQIWVSGITGDNNPVNDTLGRWQGIGTSTGISDLAPLGLRVFPNPVTDILTLDPATSLPLRGLDLRLTNLAGQQVLPTTRYEVVTESLHLDLSLLPPGLYILQARDAQGRQTLTMVQKI